MNFNPRFHKADFVPGQGTFQDISVGKCYHNLIFLIARVYMGQFMSLVISKLEVDQYPVKHRNGWHFKILRLAHVFQQFLLWQRHLI
jgi:hypothetical protein